MRCGAVRVGHAVSDEIRVELPAEQGLCFFKGREEGGRVRCRGCRFEDGGAVVFGEVQAARGVGVNIVFCYGVDICAEGL